MIMIMMMMMVVVTVAIAVVMFYQDIWKLTKLRILGNGKIFSNFIAKKKWAS